MSYLGRKGDGKQCSPEMTKRLMSHGQELQRGNMCTTATVLGVVEFRRSCKCLL